MSPLLPSSLAPIKLANPDLPGKMAAKTETEITKFAVAFSCKLLQI